MGGVPCLACCGGEQGFMFSSWRRASRIQRNNGPLIPCRIDTKSKHQRSCPVWIKPPFSFFRQRVRRHPSRCRNRRLDQPLFNRYSTQRLSRPHRRRSLPQRPPAMTLYGACGRAQARCKKAYRDTCNPVTDTQTHRHRHRHRQLTGDRGC